MSVFGNIVRRADGVDEREEDNRIYRDDKHSWEELDAFIHEGYECKLYTNGRHPAIAIKIGEWKGDRFLTFIDTKGNENKSNIIQCAPFLDTKAPAIDYLLAALENDKGRWTVKEVRQTVDIIVKKLKEIH